MKLSQLNKLIKNFAVLGIADWSAARLIALAEYVAEQNIKTTDDFKSAVEQYKASVR